MEKTQTVKLTLGSMDKKQSPINKETKAAFA